MSRFLKVWSTFSATTKKGGTVFNFSIVDMPEFLREVVIKLYTNYFIKQEATFKAAGIPKNVEAIHEIYKPILNATKAPGFHTVVCCLNDKDGQIKDVAGASLMALRSVCDPEPENEFDTPEMKKLFESSHGLSDIFDEDKFKTPEIKKLFEISDVMSACFDEVKELNLDRYYSDRGMFVCPQYRRLGIAQELIKVRKMICREHGIPIHGAWTTSHGTQIAGERDGWKTVCEIPIEKLEKKCGVTFEDCPPSFKYDCQDTIMLCNNSGWFSFYSFLNKK